MTAHIIDHPLVSSYGVLHRVSGAASYLGVSQTTVRRLIRSGELKAAWKPNQRLRGIYTKQLEDWLAETTADCQSAPKPLGVDARMAQLKKQMGIATR